MFRGLGGPRLPFLLTAVALLAAAGAIREPTASAQIPGTAPARATVFIRAIGDVELVRPRSDPAGERHFTREDVQLATGSGVLISPSGHILTAAHVVAGERGTVTLDGVEMEVQLTVRTVEVLLPAEAGGALGPPLQASILAIDPSLDLAIISVNGYDLPFLDLGDSDALAVGDPLEAAGYPFGDAVEVGRPRSSPPPAPSPSVSRGNLAAFRDDLQGERRYLQVTTPLNAGNSGGPIVDGDGYVVAIANSVLRSGDQVATGVGFGVPVSLAKRFLESNGQDVVLRARRVFAGPPFTLEGKGLRLALLAGTNDSSPARTRVEAGSGGIDGIVMRVDRVLSPWPAARIAGLLASGQAFEAFEPSASVPAQAVSQSGGRLLIGRASGVAEGSAPVAVEYAVLESGQEKAVVRFVGPPHQLAYNASVLRAALRQAEMQRLRGPAGAFAGTVSWALPAGSRGNALDRVPLPAGWIPEPSAPFACPGLRAASDAAAASPPGDFAVTLQAGWIAAPAPGAERASAACGTPRAGDPSSYTREFTFLGIRYLVEGRFVEASGGLLHLESVAPSDAAPAVRPAFAEWVRQVESASAPGR